jgi:hypothetical protein
MSIKYRKLNIVVWSMGLWGNVRRKYTVTIYDRLVSGDTIAQ